MSAAPPVLDAAIAALLLASIGRAFFGPPPDRSDLLAAAAWMLAGATLLGFVLIAGHAARPRDLLAAGGVEAICVAGWRLRQASRGGGGGDSDPAPEGDPPVDWDEFDRARAGWRPRPRDPAGV